MKTEIQENQLPPIITKEEAKKRGMFCLTSRIHVTAEKKTLQGILSSLRGVSVALVKIGRENNYQLWRSGKEAK